VPGAAKTAETDGGAKGLPAAARPDAPAAGKTAEAVGHGGANLGPGKMVHCPSAVDGAKTKIRGQKDAVELTITAKSKEATKEIRTRASHLGEVADAASTGAHDGKGHFGGGMGRCVRITIKPATAGALPALKEMVKQRQDAIQARTK
jgi:hypothetical protein